ncbi:hypothetical protein [Rhodococcus opacus]|uniref:hypothetical protein n=1 Tax=Rhodococcus opacus TaxID=37919 RepID=UPI002952A7DF|nr:hypothetical protein [Rhodococcus opacus]MDV7089179.1 hypothetical protein [Rhodococcus opacus]
MDTVTGEELEPVVVDADTGKSLDDTEAFVFAAGPAASAAIRARYAELRRRPVTGPKEGEE